MIDTMTPDRILTERPGGAWLIADLPEHERPRERLQQRGADALGDAELLAILLRTGCRNRSAVDLARDLIAHCGGSLRTLADARLQELALVKGIGLAKAVEIQAAFALAGRLRRFRDADRPRLQSPGDVADFLREGFRGRTREEFHVLMLDPRHHLLRDECVTIGLADRSQVHAREVFRGAIRENACRVLLAHNHPSGDPSPSPQDIECTRGLVGAGKLVGIEVIDHIIIGHTSATRTVDWLSFKEANLL